jgi:hypothetical protein
MKTHDSIVSMVKDQGENNEDSGNNENYKEI